MELEPRNIAMSLTLVLLLFGAADVLLVAQSPLGETGTEILPGSETPGETEPAETVPGVDVLPIVTQAGFTVDEATTDPTFLHKVIPAGEATVESKVLLLNGDRAGSLTWVDTAKVRLYYFALKEALHSSFTAAITGLKDETQRQGDLHRNYLAFTDTGISDERITFVRFNDRLYEIHAAPGREQALDALIDSLTSWQTQTPPPAAGTGTGLPPEPAPAQ